MGQTRQERNKALVLEAFDALFNRRDYTAAERFWSPGYIQHSAHIAPGREGLFDLVRSLPPTSIRARNDRIITRCACAPPASGAPRRPVRRCPTSPSL